MQNISGLKYPNPHETTSSTCIIQNPNPIDTHFLFINESDSKINTRAK